MDTVSESSMAASASEASPSSTTTTPRSTALHYPLRQVPPHPLASDTIFKSPSDFIDSGDDFASSPCIFVTQNGDSKSELLGLAPLVSGEDGEVVDVFSAKDVERIRGFPAGAAVVGGRWGFHGGRGDGDEVRLGLLKASLKKPRRPKHVLRWIDNKIRSDCSLDPCDVEEISKSNQVDQPPYEKTFCWDPSSWLVGDLYEVKNGSNSVSDPSQISNGSETEIIRNGIYSVSNQKRN
ncbi:hypothetical protein Syun_029434 [Stephania yunnanensis]|uniref:Uncharacterized protein n=1 Tax=Stephania yunnanensis TaxID=152371 RepID=A0AAP0E5C7_9MAGN